MSWYFFGGFSAYATVPSARVVNHSGLVVDPGMVRCGLKGEIEGHLEAQLIGPSHEGVEVPELSEIRMDGVVPTVLGADRPR